jgi:hypothetical protein
MGDARRVVVERERGREGERERAIEICKKGKIYSQYRKELVSTRRSTVLSLPIQ